MKNLILMTDFLPDHPYSKFLKQPLELWMFVPCDEDGNVLEEPKISCASCKECTCSESYQIKYQQAKERCLFYSQHGDKELFDVSLAKVYLDEFFNIEQLANEIRGIKLTQNAIK